MGTLSDIELCICTACLFTGSVRPLCVILAAGRSPLYGMQVTSTNVDIATVAPDYHLYNQSEVEEVISRL